MPDRGAPDPQATVGDLLGLDHFKLSARVARPASPGEHRLRRIGLPLGVAVFLIILLAPRA
ncbi:MAG TPA: hypothetical protein VFI13_06780, partial [Gemmatimonadales bacterium]|nr:hypothetical protein [Gemmatimonadales bacterium]